MKGKLRTTTLRKAREVVTIEPRPSGPEAPAERRGSDPRAHIFYSMPRSSHQALAKRPAMMIRTDFSASANFPLAYRFAGRLLFFSETCEHIIDQPFHVLAVE